MWENGRRESVEKFRLCEVAFFMQQCLISFIKVARSACDDKNDRMVYSPNSVQYIYQAELVQQAYVVS